MRNVVCIVAVALLGGCTYAQLNARGQQVELVDSAPRGCQNLGPVVGKGGGGGGSFVRNEELIEYAMNDARNKAAERGATHLTYSAPGLGVSGGQHGSSVTSATLTGIAYRCAGDAAPTGAAEVAPQPGPPPPAPVTRAPSPGAESRAE
jgi:hypothetical protein